MLQPHEFRNVSDIDVKINNSLTDNCACGYWYGDGGCKLKHMFT